MAAAVNGNGLVVDAAGVAARSAGNRAYLAGDMGTAADHYAEALNSWERALCAAPQPDGLEVGQLVQYCDKGFFGTVMSCFPLFDEYFLKDLGSDQAMWAGDPGRDLRRFARKELVAVSRELVDFRLAVLQNLAAVCLRQDKWEQTVKWADMALCIQGRSPKALMRKGAALLQLNQPGPASDVLATAAEEIPNDVEVRRLLRDAEKRRSPMWVCVTGCCGPWGIVCGGPVAQTVPEVIAPASKGPSMQARIRGEEVSDAAGAEADRQAVAVAMLASSLVVDESVAPMGGDPPMVEAPAPRAAELPQPAPEQEPADAAPAEEVTDTVCRSRRQLPAEPGRQTQGGPADAASDIAEQRAASMEKGATGLLFVAAGAFSVAMLAVVWMLSLSAEGPEG